jgi:hypothetical protein
MDPKKNNVSKDQQEHQKREEGLDKTLAESFPSSDPPSTIPDPMSNEETKDTAMPETKDKTNEEPDQGMTGKADRAFRATAQSYLDRAGIKFDLQQLENTIREQPVLAAAIAAAAGFLVGGGMATRLGAAMLAFLGRRAFRDTASNLVGGIVQTAAR